MLSDASAAFLDSATEREFDQPFLALLRDQGFDAPKLTHGAFEFGKDFIARKDGLQWVFQSKAGDIGTGEWRSIKAQVDELRLSDYAGPEFDPSLDRVAVLVTTGKITGGAPLRIAEYNQQAKARGEIEVRTWEREDLVGYLTARPDAVLSGSFDGGLHTILGAIDRGSVSFEAIDQLAQRWDTFPHEKLIGMGVVELSIVANRLKEINRLDLACHLAACFVRASWAGESTHEDSVFAANIGAEIFDTYANELWSRCDEKCLEPREFLYSSASSADSAFAEWATYPVRCCRLIEILGLWILRLRPSDPPLAQTVASWLARFVVAQPGAAHPLGDRYAVSPIPALVALIRDHPESAQHLLVKTAIWMCDHYDRGQIGLAPLVASPREEIERAFGGAYEQVQLERRDASQLAAVLLDVSAILFDIKMFADIRNDQLAVRLVPEVLRCKPDGHQFSLDSLDNRWDLNPEYPDDPQPGDLESINHHKNDPASAELVELGRAWDLLAASSSLRDRHFPGAIRWFALQGTQQADQVA